MSRKDGGGEILEEDERRRRVKICGVGRGGWDVGVVDSDEGGARREHRRKECGDLSGRREAEGIESIKNEKGLLCALDRMFSLYGT